MGGDGFGVDGRLYRGRFGIGMPDVRPAVGHASRRVAHTHADLHATLLDVARATASHRDLATLLRDLVEVLHRVARFDRVALVLHDPTFVVMRLHRVDALHQYTVNLVEVPL